MAAAELLLAGERHGDRAEATHTAALSRAGIKPGQYKSLSGWGQELVLAAIGKMIVMTAAAPPALKATAQHHSSLGVYAMTAEELALEAMATVSNRGQAEYFYSTTRNVRGIMKAAAEMVIAGERPGGAEALHTVALARAGISAKQYAAVSAMKREIVTNAIAHLAEKSAGGNPKAKTRELVFRGKTLTVTPKGSVTGDDGWKCNSYGIACGDEEFEDVVMPTGRSLSDHLTMTGGLKPKTASRPVPPLKRRGRPPIGNGTMTNRERQARFQERLRKAPDTIQQIKTALATPGKRAAEKVLLIEALITAYEREGRS